MGKAIDVMKDIREEQLTRVIQSLVFLGFIILIASISRSLFLGWHKLMYVHIGAYAVILGIAVFRNYLSHISKTTLLISLIFILSLIGLSTLGLIGHGVGGFLIFCILSTIFFGTRGGVLSVVISAISISIVGVAVVNGNITFDFNILEYLSSPSAWVTCVIGTISITGLIVAVLSTINNQLIELVQNLNKQNTELMEANKELEKTLDEKDRLKTGLEQAQKMELVGTIAGGVAHDLNNVLAASINYPELLLLKMPEDSSSRAPLEAIKKSGLKAAAIVQDLLTLARRGVPVTEVFNLNHIVHECITSPEIERIRSYHPNMDLEIRLEDNLWNIEGSSFHLMKTITNLVSNAAEAMSDGGKVVIETLNLKIHPTLRVYEAIETGQYVVLSVSDTGTGISEKDKYRIFEPFYTKKVMGRSGTGLGMSVVWNTVNDHKGHIKMDSIEGKGTSFSLYFPITDKPLTPKKEQPPISVHTGKGESILVVDDVREQRELAASILSMLGYSVATSASGEEALEFIKNRPADLVILDMIMGPGMDGLDTYKKILELHPGQKTIITSGFSETDRVKEAQRLGAGAYVQKPYLMEKVALAVRAELDSKSSEKINYH
jgi:signal transduction histidine kinase/CheY-like chemotaxis protein